MERENLSYQTTLRSLGALLDGRQAHSISVLETPTGFTARYLAEEGPRLERFPFEALLPGRVDLHQPGRRGREAGGSYQNLLRALGHELDELAVYDLLLEQVEEELVVAFQYLNPAEGFMIRKRMIVLGSEDIDKLLEAAAARRRRQKRGLLRELLAS